MTSNYLFSVIQFELPSIFSGQADKRTQHGWSPSQQHRRVRSHRQEEQVEAEIPQHSATKKKIEQQEQKQMEQQKNGERRMRDKSGRLKKKARLRTSQEVHNRIMWDDAYDPSDFVVGYMDRFDGMMEIALNEFLPIDKGGDIAYHRIYYFRQGNVVMWDRNKRIDRIFGSGATPNGSEMAEDDASASSSGGEDKEDKEKDQESTTTTASEQQTQQAATTPAQPKDAMPKLRSCGILLFADVPANSGSRHFLLMKHAQRYDLPKGHIEPGETDRECALREVREETGIEAESIQIDPDFVYTETYYPVYKRFGGKKVEKTLCMFLGFIAENAVLDPTTGMPVVRRTEHGGHEWLKWNPPHHIQKNTIDPLLKAANDHFKLLKDEAREKQARLLSGEEDLDHEEEEDEDDEENDEENEDGEEGVKGEVAEAGTVERSEEKEKLERERTEKTEKEKEQKVRRRTDYNARKTRRKRNAMVSGGGYALLDKVRDESGHRGRVGIYEESGIVFDESALTTQAKLILKRNDRANRRLDESVHRYAGDEESDEEISDEEAARYCAAPTKGKLGEFMGIVPADAGALAYDGGEGVAVVSVVAPAQEEKEEEWGCQACTYVNKPSFLCCEVCSAERN